MKRTMRILVAAVTLLGLSVGCQTDGAPGEDVRIPGRIADGNNAFALDLYRQLRRSGDNLIVSPLSISTVLTMTYTGASGKTAQEMADTLHLPLTGAELNRAMGETVASLNVRRDAAPFKLYLANALWGQRGEPVRSDFRDAMERYYQAGYREVNYRGDPEAARSVINAWAAENTQNHIRDLIPARVLTPDTRLVLTNAIYFKGAWRSKFRRESTAEKPFFVSHDRIERVPMMYRSSKFPFAETEDCMVLELPYVGDSLSMIVILPAKKDGLEALESSLTMLRLQNLVSGLYPTTVEVSLPRFRLRTSAMLREPLQALGIRTAFERTEADFSGMQGTTREQEKRWYLDDVVHQAFIDVNEEGTEAAAATGTIGRVTAARPQVFQADHPFLFLIAERRTRCILFMGRFVDPTRV